MTMDSYHKADNQKRAGLSLTVLISNIKQSNYEIEIAQNLFLNHWPLTGFLPGSTNQGYKTYPPGRELSDQSGFPMRDTCQILRKKMPKHHPCFHLRQLCSERVSSLPLSLKIFHYYRRQQGNFSVVRVNLLSMRPRAPGKSGKMLLWNHRTWYKDELVSRLAIVFLSCL